MDKLSQSIDNVAEEREQIIDELKALREHPLVKRYLELTEKNDYLFTEQKKLIKQFKLKEFDFCEHLWIVTKCEREYIEGRTEKFCGCVKCGLNQEVLHKAEGILGVEILTFEEQIMYDYLKNGIYLKGNIIPVSCDIDLARSIYLRIKENNPGIDDNTSRKYFEIALDNIRKTKVSDERKANRAKRLYLSSKFDRWNACDIEN